jgi:hypothetical protein
MVKEDKYGATLAEVLLVVSLLLLAILAITPPKPPMKSSLAVQKSEDGYSVVMQNAFIGMDKVANNKANFYGGLYWSAVQGTDIVARPEFPSLSDSTMVMYWKEKEM